MQSIPRSILNHSVVYYERLSVDEYGNTTYKTGVNVNYVRVEPVKESSLKALGEMANDKVLMFYDYKNSSPLGITFKELDKVVFNSKDYFIRVVNDYINHHCEVILR